MEHQVYKEHHRRPEKISDVLRTASPGSRVLIVFWHGVGDTLMFLPLYDFLKNHFPDLRFDLGLLPGVGQAEFLDALALPEAEFLANHDAAFVISFPMVEGGEGQTKTEYCCRAELGLEPPACGFGLPTIKLVQNRLVGMHLQGTCLPGSTNPDDPTAKIMWEDLRSAGFVPLDLHFVHAFHNPANAPFVWASRNCRDLRPDLQTLQMLIDRCAVVVAVASGPFVLSAAINRHKTVYLQKHHHIGCYMRDFQNVIDLQAYADGSNTEGQARERLRLIEMVRDISERGDA